MNQIIAFALSAVMALSLGACGGRTVPEKSSGGESVMIGGVQIPSPITEYDSLEEAEAAAGFSVTVPEVIDDYPERLFQVFNAGNADAMLQVICRDGEEDIIHIRKAAGTEDVSGDYSQYAEIETAVVEGLDVTMKGNDGRVHLAVWTNGGYTYSVAVCGETGISADGMAELVAAVR